MCYGKSHLAPKWGSPPQNTKTPRFSHPKWWVFMPGIGIPARDGLCIGTIRVSARVTDRGD